jgi:hypothetical protein
MFSSFTGSFKFGRRRVLPTTDLILDLDASTYGESGDWQDATANNLDAVAVQSPTHSSTDGGYFDLNGGAISGSVGSVDSFEIADNSKLESGFSAVSFEIYFWIDTVQTPGANLLFDKRSATTNGFVGFFNNTGYTFRVGTASPNQIAYTTTPVTNAWQHMVVTVANSGSKIYLNGAEVASSAYAGDFSAIDSANSLRIGDIGFNNTGIFGLDGRIKIFRIYNKALTAAEAEQKYLDAAVLVSTNLQLYLDPATYIGSGTSWIDSSANAYTTTLVGAPAYTSGSLDYFTYDGTTEYVDTNQSLGFESFSVGAWFRTSAAGIKMIVSKETTGGWPWTYRIWLNDGQIITDIAQNAGASVGVNSPLTTYNNGDWYLVMLTRNDSNLYLYVNGVQVATAADTLTGTIVNSQEVWWGRSAFTNGGASPTGNYQYTGDLGELFVYDRVLTSGEILQNYDATKSKYGL